MHIDQSFNGVAQTLNLRRKVQLNKPDKQLTKGNDDSLQQTHQRVHLQRQ